MSDSVSNIVKTIQNLSVSELVSLTGELSQSLGVDTELLQHDSGAGDLSGRDPLQHDSGPGDLSGRDSFTVVLRSYGDSKLSVIKIVRETLGVDLHTAKDVVEACGVLVANYPREETLRLVEQLREVGATCELR